MSVLLQQYSGIIQSTMWMFVVLLGTALLAVVSAINIDLTHGIDENSQYWLNVQPFVFTKKTAVISDGNWYAANEFCAGEHGGTHFDAPYHFSREGWRVGDVPLDNLIAPGVVLDVSAEASGHPDFELNEGHVQNLVDDPLLPEKVIVLVKYGWSQYYTNRTAYYGTASNDSALLHFPGMSGAAAQLLVNTGKVVGFGVDTPSVDRGQASGPHVHRLLSAANIYSLENLDMATTDLPATGFTLYVMPMKIAEGSGAPCRIVAVVH